MPLFLRRQDFPLALSESREVITQKTPIRFCEGGTEPAGQADHTTPILVKTAIHDPVIVGWVPPGTIFTC